MAGEPCAQHGRIGGESFAHPTYAKTHLKTVILTVAIVMMLIMMAYLK